MNINFEEAKEILVKINPTDFTHKFRFHHAEVLFGYRVSSEFRCHKDKFGITLIGRLYGNDVLTGEVYGISPSKSTYLDYTEVYNLIISPEKSHKRFDKPEQQRYLKERFQYIERERMNLVGIEKLHITNLNFS